MTIEIYIILCESNYQKEILTSPAHGVHVFRSAKRTLSLFQLGHHICLLASFHDSSFFFLPPPHNFLVGSISQWNVDLTLAFGSQSSLTIGREHTCLELESNSGSKVCRPGSVSCGFWRTRPCYALFPLPSDSRASHCALATADVGLAQLKHSVGVIHWYHHYKFFEVNAITDLYIWSN